jgi:hypothetical protein
MPKQRKGAASSGVPEALIILSLLIMRLRSGRKIFRMTSAEFPIYLQCAVHVYQRGRKGFRQRRGSVIVTRLEVKPSRGGVGRRDALRESCVC